MHNRKRKRQLGRSLTLTKHSRRRSQQRGIPDRGVDLAYRYGDVFYVGDGRMAYFLSDRSIARVRKPPTDLRHYRRVAVITEERALVTCFKTDRPLKHWRSAR